MSTLVPTSIMTSACSSTFAENGALGIEERVGQDKNTNGEDSGL